MRIALHDFGWTAPVAAGGAVHAQEVLKRLTRNHDVTLLPGSIFLEIDGSQRAAGEQWGKRMESYGVRVPAYFYDYLSRFDAGTPWSGLGFRGKVIDWRFPRVHASALLKGYEAEVGQLDFVYSADARLASMYFASFSRLARGRHGMTVHGWYVSSRNYLRRQSRLIDMTGDRWITRTRRKASESLFVWYNRRLLSSELERFPPRFVAGVSRGVFDEMDSSVRRRLRGIEILYPGNAFNPEILRYRGRAKDDYAIFLARVTPSKGILEALEVVRRLKTRLVVVGTLSPSDSALIRARALGTNVSFAGFVDERKKYELLARARVMVHPTHGDILPISVLEALAAGTPVVAYDLPGPSAAYSGLPGIRFVREFDVGALTREVQEFLRLPEKELEDLLNSERLMTFLGEHDSWDKVAAAHEQLLLKHAG